MKTIIKLMLVFILLRVVHMQFDMIAIVAERLLMLTQVNRIEGVVVFGVWHKEYPTVAGAE